MHCFASENQTYTGTWLFGVESWKSLKGQENLLLKNLQVKTRVENVWFLWWRIFFEGKCGIQSTNDMAFKRTVTLRYCHSEDSRMRMQNALLLGSSILMPSRGITGVRDFLSFFFSFFFFHSFSPRSLTGFLYSHASPRHNRSPPLPFSYILPFLFFFLFSFFILSHHVHWPGSSILMPARGITGVRDFLSPTFFLFLFSFFRTTVLDRVPLFRCHPVA